MGSGCFQERCWIWKGCSTRKHWRSGPSVTGCYLEQCAGTIFTAALMICHIHKLFCISRWRYVKTLTCLCYTRSTQAPKTSSASLPRTHSQPQGKSIHQLEKVQRDQTTPCAAQESITKTTQGIFKKKNKEKTVNLKGLLAAILQ